MELAVSGISGASAIVALSYYGMSCWGHVKAPHLIQKSCLVIPKGCGKSSLVKKFEGNDKDLLVVDLDELVKKHPDTDKQFLEGLEKAREGGDDSTYRVLYQQLAKTVYQSLKSSWLTNRCKRLLCLTGSLELAQELFKTSSIFVGSPSNKLFTDLVYEVEDNIKEVMRRERTNLISELAPKQIFVYDTFAELNAKLQLQFNIKHHL